eukprot:gene8320-8505_t
MDDKKGLEAFRVLQFSGPHPAAATLKERPASPACQHDIRSSNVYDGDAQAPDMVPNYDRIVVHIDVDCFYAQVEEVRNPSLRDRPLAVTQKYLVVTANYVARKRGVTKLMGIQEARRICPDLVLVPGEDLTPYRTASRDIRRVLSRWGPTEKLGLDESWVDVTQVSGSCSVGSSSELHGVKKKKKKGVAREVDQRCAATGNNSSGGGGGSGKNSCGVPDWCGHVVAAGMALTADSKHRPQDLRVKFFAKRPAATAVAAAAGAAAGADVLPGASATPAADLLLLSAKNSVTARRDYNRAVGLAPSSSTGLEVRQIHRQPSASGAEVVEEYGDDWGDAGAAEEQEGFRGVGDAADDVVLAAELGGQGWLVELLDHPHLRGQPVAVSQFNQGGFVSVSYEARAAGVRPGDGVGPGGRAALQHLKDIGAVSEAEAKRRCPGLVVLPMRPWRYRQVAAQLHQLLIPFAPDGQAALVNTLNITVSCGVASSKLLARLACPMQKPNGVTALPAAVGLQWLQAQPIRRIPQLQQKKGSAVVQGLGVETVGQLLGFSEQQLRQQFGAVVGGLLYDLPRGLTWPGEPVRQRGPVKQLAVTRSCSALASGAEVQAALQPLVAELWQRLVDDAACHNRLPLKLGVTWRLGYGSTHSTALELPQGHRTEIMLDTGPPPGQSYPWSIISLDQLRRALQVFAKERQWEQYHTPRNLLLALVGEVGELAEIFQWKGEVANNLPTFTPAEKQHVGEELSDVLLYLIRLADVCGVDLGKAALDKLAHNSKKYPADRCQGKADKYTAYASDSHQPQQQPQQQQVHHQHQPPSVLVVNGAGSQPHSRAFTISGAASGNQVKPSSSTTPPLSPNMPQEVPGAAEPTAPRQPTTAGDVKGRAAPPASAAGGSSSTSSSGFSMVLVRQLAALATANPSAAVQLLTANPRDDQRPDRADLAPPPPPPPPPHAAVSAAPAVAGLATNTVNTDATQVVGKPDVV